MNNIVTNFDQILEQAAAGGVPPQKRRGILREYLQIKFLTGLYRRSEARKLSFVGGTALRILHGIGRFSQDLDFDNLGLARTDLSKLIANISEEFRRENIAVEVSAKLKPGIAYHSLRFPKLMFDLKISTNPKEKLMIKIDYSNQWKGQKTETMLVSKYGLIEQIITNPLPQIMVQKLAAYVNRKRTQPRDMFDLVWLFSQGTHPDREFMRINRMADLIKQAQEKFAAEGAGEAVIRRLRPFLFDEKEIRKVKLLGEVLKQLE
jgi:predicted nucleotidyltransferase component of viral defense system